MPALLLEVRGCRERQQLEEDIIIAEPCSLMYLAGHIAIEQDGQATDERLCNGAWPSLQGACGCWQPLSNKDCFGTGGLLHRSQGCIA
jgi:hypothetical protein